MSISILEVKFVRKNCALYTGKYGIQILREIILQNLNPTLRKYTRKPG